MAPTNKSTKAAAMQQPDMEAHDAQMKSFKASIEDLHKEVQEISKQIAAKSQGKKEYQDKKNNMQQMLKEYQDIISGHEVRRNEIRAAEQEARNKNRQAKQDMQEKKDKLPFSSVKQIDSKIEGIEYRMATTSMSLTEEKKLMEEMKNLRKMRPEVAKFAREQGAATEGTDNANKSKLDAIRAEIDEARAAKKKQQEQKDKLIEKRKEMTAGIDELFKRRDELNKKISQHIQARQQVRDDFNEKKREYAAHMAEQRTQRQAKQQADSLTRQADRENRRVNDLNEQEEVNPFVSEIIAYEQAISYCSGLIKKEEVVVEEKKETEHTNPEGYVVMTKTKVVDQKKGKKLRTKGNKENKSSNTAPIKHNLGTIEAFSKLKLIGEANESAIIPPNSVADVPEILEKLNLKIEHFRSKVQTWEADRQQRKEELARTIKEAEAKADELRRQAAIVLEQAAKKEAKKEAEAAAVEVEAA